MEVTLARYFAKMGIRETGHGWVEMRDQGRSFGMVWFDMFCFLEMGDIEEVSLQVGMIQERGVVDVCEYV